jgi:hypothetical protein
VAGPHRPWSDRPHSAARLARVRACLTLEQLAAATALSASQLARMEVDGVGSDEAWAVVARVLGEPVERIRPARGGEPDDRQLALLEPALQLGGSSS